MIEQHVPPYAVTENRVMTMTDDGLRLPRQANGEPEALLLAADQAAEAELALRMDPQVFVERARRRTVRVPLPVRRRDEEPTDWSNRLSPLEKALLERLAAGATIAAAATEEFLSLRTANRRIADLRGRAGVTTTRELVRLYKALR